MTSGTTVPGVTLDEPALRRALGATWSSVRVVERTGSTNADLLAAVRAALAEVG